MSRRSRLRALVLTAACAITAGVLATAAPTVGAAAPTTAGLIGATPLQVCTQTALQRKLPSLLLQLQHQLPRGPDRA